MRPLEILLVASDDALDEERLSRAGWRISQRVSPRVLVAVPPNVGPGLPPGVGATIVLSAQELSAVEERLDEGEALFARAWLERLGKASRFRRGDGLAWDAPGFTPPDPTDRGGAGND